MVEVYPVSMCLLGSFFGTGSNVKTAFNFFHKGLIIRTTNKNISKLTKKSYFTHFFFSRQQKILAQGTPFLVSIFPRKTLVTPIMRQVLAHEKGSVQIKILGKRNYEFLSLLIPLRLSI